MQKQTEELTGQAQINAEMARKNAWISVHTDNPLYHARQGQLEKDSDSQLQIQDGGWNYALPTMGSHNRLNTMKTYFRTAGFTSITCYDLICW